MIEETKKISKKAPLFLEIERKFTDEHTKEAERQRLEKLKEIKAQHQPVSKDDISSHARKYEDIIRQKREELKVKRGVLDSVSSNNGEAAGVGRSHPESARIAPVQSSERIKNYKSKFYLDQVEEDRGQKELREKEKMSKKRMAEKANNYAKYVREMYAPQVSEDNVLLAQ